MKIIKNTPIWFGLSTALVAISFAVFALNFFQMGTVFKYGIDFTGGTQIEIKATTEGVDADAVKNALTPYAEYTPSVQAAENGVFLIKMKTVTNEEHDKIIASLDNKLGEIEETKFITMGPSVGETMKSRAFMAIAIAIIAIVLYIAFAFREIPKRLSAWKFGFATIVALLHDVIVTMGAFGLFGIFMGAEVDTLFITALLTVLGFSVHDTIVVFDRLRENAKFARPTETFAEIAEKSVIQTMSRSINTSVAVIFPLTALFLFGAESIRFFTLALIVGIVIGTYSSIFLATPALVKWQGEDVSDLNG